METGNRKKRWLTTDRATVITWITVPMMLFTPWVAERNGTIGDLLSAEPLAAALLLALTALVVLPAALGRVVPTSTGTVLCGVALGAMITMGFLVLSTVSMSRAYACAYGDCSYGEPPGVIIPWGYLAGLVAAVVNVLARTESTRQEMR
ncbi:hypothetical protein ACQBAR_03600 [Propionibacteriaceae bacterium Y1685]